MADIWDAYIKKFGSAPKDATQLQQFSKSTPNIKPLSFKEARDMFNSHKNPPLKIGQKPTTKPKINKPLPSAQKYNTQPKTMPNINTSPNNQEIRRQINECNEELSNLNTIESEFTSNYNIQITDIENQFKNLYNAIKKRELDLKKWRKQEFDEGINIIASTKQILNHRMNELNTNNNNNIIYNIPKLNDFNITRFTKHSLQMQNTLNNIFQIGETYQQNINNKQFISLKINKNPLNNVNNIRMRTGNNNMNNNNNISNDKRKLDFSSSPFGKGKIVTNNNMNNNRNNKVKQNNGTKVLQYNNNNVNAKGIRGFDIGNNAKYGNAQQMAQNTNALPSNFWESESDSDSEQERQETTDEIVNRWQNQESNIITKTRPKKRANNNNNCKQMKPTIKHTRVRSMYDASSSDDDNDNDDENDGFKKYIPPKPKPIDPQIEKEKQKKEEENYWKNNNTKWIIYSENKQFEYDSLWFKVPKLRNGKANGKQMKPFMQKSGLQNNILKHIWKLSDLDKDGKMGNEEFALCMYLMDKAKKGDKMPDKLPQNYIPPSFRGQRLIKTPPKKSKPLPNSKSVPPKMNLASAKGDHKSKPKPKPNAKPKPIIEKQNENNGSKYKVKPKKIVEKKDDKKEDIKEVKKEVNKENNVEKTDVKKDEKKEVKSEDKKIVNNEKDNTNVIDQSTQDNVGITDNNYV